jgi:tripartite-type tricarboxylate transporter receptor subunit TctC
MIWKTGDGFFAGGINGKEQEVVNRDLSGKRAAGWLTFFLILTLASACWAQYPTKPITLIVGYAVGGITDVSARALCGSATKFLGQPIVVMNKPGGGSAVSIAFLKNEKPDGYSLATLSPGAIISAHVRKLPYDVTKDFTPILAYAENFSGVVVRADSPWKTFKELHDYAKDNPGKIKYSTPGVATIHHLAMERMGLQEGIKWVHIPYQGGQPAVTGLLGGHVDVAASSPEWIPHVKAGRLRLLATYSGTRFPKFPEAPTWMELGYNIAVKITTSVIGPKGIPGPIVDKLHGALKTGLDDPNFKKTLDGYDMTVYYRNPTELAREISEFSDQWGKIIRELGLKQD